MNTRSSTAEEIYKILKKRILHLEYKPGLALSALTLSEEMNVSRSPAREALIKLSADDLVDIFPQIGTRVSLINLNKVTEERFLRKSLEESALRFFAEKHTDDDITFMKEILIDQKKAWIEKDFVKFITLDDEFHQRVFTAINKPRCWTLMNSFGSNEFRLRLLSCQYVEKTPESVIKNHEDLIEAILDGGIQRVLDITHQHLSRISNEIPKLLEDFPEIFSMDNGEKSSRYQRKSANSETNFLKSI